jgi:hypothetical protein
MRDFVLAAVLRRLPAYDAQQTGRANTFTYVFVSAYTPHEGLGDFRRGVQVIHTVKFADDLVLLDKEETGLQGMIGRVIELQNALEWK